MPTADPSLPADARTTPASADGSTHILQLFDEPASLGPAVAEFLIAGLASGAPVIVIARPAHWTAMARVMTDRGVDVRESLAAGRLMVLDAPTTLRALLHGGLPDRTLFAHVVAATVRQLAARSAHGVWAYGEMVDVLAEQCDWTAINELEQLWNELAAVVPITLLCGYLAGNFAPPRARAALDAICRAHTHVARNPDDMLSTFLLAASAPPPHSAA